MNQIPLEELVAYTDGSCPGIKSANPHRASWGLCIMQSGAVIHEASGEVSGPVELLKMRNVAGEIKAAMEAVRWARDNDRPVHLCFDYRGVECWALGQWRRKNKFTRAYHAFMKANMQHIQSFIWVKGHTNVPGNDRADRLAGAVLR